ncbi:hypothetical protein [Clostridium massiliamazoniense]|uniref:hypothetical protein n=1 Tax=Clostridium massiliamazoniense TaxID=1347366 RepID=UPI0006D83D13|nr:hypothetical protein [Clostridium massiliamazoniense]
MELTNFLEQLLDGIVKEDGMDKILQSIEENIEYDLKNTKVELQLFECDKNYDADIVVSNEGYEDGEIIFLDIYKKSSESLDKEN